MQDHDFEANELEAGEVEEDKEGDRNSNVQVGLKYNLNY